MGRFLQTDPTRFAGSDINLYRYVGNNPPNQTDPLGLYTKAWVSAPVTAEPTDNTCPKCPSKVTGYGYDEGDGNMARANATIAAHADCEAQKGNLPKGCKAGACSLENIENHPLKEV
jgi:hypothetical protein